MTEDRELLELAAKAAGLKVDYVPEHGCFWIALGQGLPINQWNPLRDDGDALRLAMRLGIYVMHIEEDGAVLARVRNGLRRSWREPVVFDLYAATRRAIVRAAAEIQRAKEAA